MGWRRWIVAISLAFAAGCEGAPSPQELSASQDEPPGANCGLGGTRTDRGLDEDFDDVLDPDEVTSTEYVCESRLEGSYTVTSAEDLVGLIGVVVITGDLIVVAPDLTVLALPDITALGGSLRLYMDGGCPSSLTDVSLTNLVSVGGDLFLGGCAGLTTLDVSSVETVGVSLTLFESALVDLDGLASLTTAEYIEIGNNSVLQDVSGLSDLASVSMMRLTNAPVHDLSGLGHGAEIVSLNIGNLPELTSLDGLDLAWVGSVSLYGLPALADLDALTPGLSNGSLVQLADLPALTDLSALSQLTSGSVLISRCDGLTDLDDLAALTSVRYLGVFENDGLRNITLPALASTLADGNISIERNAQLSELRLPSLMGAGRYIRVLDNSVLPVCYATEIRAQMLAAGWSDNSGMSAIGGVPCEDIDRCRLQSPLDVSATVGQGIDVHGRVLAVGLTNDSVAVDVSPALIAQVGVGARATDPASDSSWSWTTASPTAGWNGTTAGESTYDDYTTQLVAGPVGLYDLAARFSGDGGRTWTLCDANAGAGSDGSQDGYQIANAGHLAVN